MRRSLRRAGVAAAGTALAACGDSGGSPHGGASLSASGLDTVPIEKQDLVPESALGHSPLRFLHAGLEVGPGLAETWSANAQLTTWTFRFRRGLCWSDGHPWTVDDVLLWWEDEVMEPALGQVPPQEWRSGKGTPATPRKVDEHTLEMSYDSPTALCADYAAAWDPAGWTPSTACPSSTSSTTVARATSPFASSRRCTDSRTPVHFPNPAPTSPRATSGGTPTSTPDPHPSRLTPTVRRPTRFRRWAPTS
ncbi:MAG TPA: ABC transporter substrate-binding protein [Candidatus Dormibacteraeota bacterium]|nr:ABC transporter substrate-binding protein [Candidatus Dormibacteraeota bacterium]